MTRAGRARAAMTFVVLMGVVSLFADACYEGARSAIGPYLANLGANATIVGAVAGTGELIGYGLRYVSGRLADRTRAYWTLTFIGYGTNVVAVPALALAGSWQAAAALVVLERLGKAIRNPARSTLLSFAAGEIGHGKSFGIHEAMDQIGAVIGPLSVAAVLWWRGDGLEGYQWAVAALAIPALLSIAALLIARARLPDPRGLAAAHAADERRPLGRAFALYMLGVVLVGFGLADWALLAFHLDQRGLIAGPLVPVIYAIAMGIDGAAALLVGSIFDRARRAGGAGLIVLSAVLVLAAASLPLVLLGSTAAAFVGVALWAIGLGATESIGKATVAVLSPPSRRGTAYGIYYSVFGGGWFAGSIAVGALSDWSPLAAGVFGAGSLALAAMVMLAAEHASRSVLSDRKPS